MSLHAGMQRLGISSEIHSSIRTSLREEWAGLPFHALAAAIDDSILKSDYFEGPISMIRNSLPGKSLGNRNFDFAILGWTPGNLSNNQLSKLSSIPTAFRLPDQRPFTGACHYSGTCDGFKNACKRCPAVGKPFRFLVEKNSMDKRKVYSKFESSVFIAPSDWIKAKANQSSLLESERVILIRNPLRSSFFDLENVKVKSEEKIILIIASQVFDPVKGFGAMRPQLESLAKKQGFRIRVAGNHAGGESNAVTQFLGRLSDDQLVSELDQAWVTVVPSAQEAAGNVVSESFARGTPALVTDTGGLAEIVKEVNHNWVCENNDEVLEKLGRMTRPVSRTFCSRLKSKVDIQRPEIVSRLYLDALGI